MTREVAIVGAGVAGAGTAYALRDAECTTTVFEKSRGVCGRAATRRKNGCVYDHGANYVTPDDGRVETLMNETLDSEGLIDIDAPVWVFDTEGEIEEGNGSDGHKWTYENGVTELAKRLFTETDAEVRTETRIESIEREKSETDGNDESEWRPIDTDGETQGSYDALVLTPPAPQTASLLDETTLDETTLDDDLRAALVAEIEAVSYRTQLTAVLHYPFAIDPPYYALVNTDHDHDVAWVSREECKPGHVPDGECVLIAQMAPNWSVERYDEPAGDVTDAAADRVSELLCDDRFSSPDWTDLQHWRFAIPDEGADSSVLERAADEALFFAGDWVVGEGRVNAALANGLTVGERIVERLG